MAEKKPLSIGSITGLPTEFNSADTLPVSNIPALTSSGISDFTEASQDIVGAMLTDSSTIDFSYNDGAGTASASVIAGSIGATELASTAVTPGGYTNTNLTVDADGRITAASNGSAGGGITATMTAGENLVSGDLVYIAVAGTLFKADANTEGKEAVGFVLSTINISGSGTVYLSSGIITGLTLTIGSKYFLSATATGGITLTPPSGTSDLVQLVGWAKSATELLFLAHTPMIRAAS